MLVQRGGDLVLSCVFGIWEYSSQPQEMCTDLFDWYYAYVGNVANGHAAIVEIKAGCFDVVQSTNMYKLGKCKQKLLADALLLVFPRISDGATQSETVDTQKIVFIPYKLVPLLAKPMATQYTFLIVHNWVTDAGSVGCCANLLNLLQVGMTLSGTATVLAVVQGQIWDPVTPLGILMNMIQKEVLLASLVVLTPNLVIFRAASNLAIENLLTKLGEVQIENLKKEKAQRVEKEQPKPIGTQYSLGG